MNILYYIKNLNNERLCRSRDGAYWSKNFSDTDRRTHKSEELVLTAFYFALQAGDIEKQPIQVIKIFIP